MKSFFVNAALVTGAMLVSNVARADHCTSDPWKMGRDAAEMACDEIVNLAHGGEGGGEEEETDIEKTCSQHDVMVCKNAMAQYLRERAPDCRHLIRTDTNASLRWYSWVIGTCNR